MSSTTVRWETPLHHTLRGEPGGAAARNGSGSGSGPGPGPDKGTGSGPGKHKPGYEPAVIAGDGVRIEEIVDRHFFVLRAKDPAPLAIHIKERYDVDLPLAPNSMALFDVGALAWISPHYEWLLMHQDSQNPLRSGAGYHVVDVSSGFCAIRVYGTDARDLLSAGCTLDFHETAFTLHKAASSLLAAAPVTIMLTSDAPVFEIMVRRSFATYLWDWFAKNSRLTRVT